MIAKTKIVDISGTRYQVRKLAPDVGSFIAMMMLGAGFKAGQMGGDPPSSSPDQSASEAMMGDAAKNSEAVVRIVAFRAFLGGLSYENHQFIQRQSLAVCSRMESKDGDTTEVPMPIMSGINTWAIPEVRDDMSLVMRLEMEALVFSLSDFFGAGGLNALAGSQAPQS